MTRHLKYIFIFVVVAIAAGSMVLFFSSDARTLLNNLLHRIPQPEDIVPHTFSGEVKKVVEPETITPKPLRAQKPSRETAGKLTRSGVIRYTNSERGKAGLPDLSEEVSLDRAAENKLADMIAKNYFAHVSPQGLGVANWVKKEGYEYFMIGENLALGDFDGDQALVAAWMGSPGHRANILNPKYREIGVAVGRGKIDGRWSWLGVQIFGRPLPSCPHPDADIKAAINSIEEQLASYEPRIRELQQDIESTPPEQRANEAYETYAQKVNTYNELARAYNTAVGQLKRLIDSYNVQTDAYNSCINGY